MPNFDVTHRWDLSREDFKKLYPKVKPGYPVAVCRSWTGDKGLYSQIKHYPVFPIYSGDRIVLELTASTLVCESRA